MTARIWRRGGFSMLRSAVAGEFCYLMLQPARNKKVAATQIVLLNVSGASQLMSIRVLTPKDVAALALGTSNSLLDFSAPQVAASDTTWPRLESVMRGTSHAAVLGTEVAQVYVSANDSRVVDLTEGPWELLGNSQEGSQPAIAIVGPAVNTRIDASYEAKEADL